MASLGADLQSTNNELVSIIEELKERRQELDRAIQREEDDRSLVAAQIQELTARLSALDQALQLKYVARKDFDETIQSTAVSFSNILDSSRVLLSTVKRDSLMLASRGNDLSPAPTASSQSMHRR
jgi:Sjoegren syndrome nuclear autoantigen 1